MTRRLTSPLSVILALVLLLAACAPAATPTAAPKPTQPPAKAAEQPKPTEAAPAAAPTKPAAAAATATPTPAGKPGQAIKVGLVTDVGKIDDKSFNQSAWEGVQRAKNELGAEVKFLETTDSKDYAKN